MQKIKPDKQKIKDPPKKKISLIRILSLLIGPVILGVIFLTLDMEFLKKSFSQVSGILLLVACLTILPTVVLRNLRWMILLREENCKIPKFTDLLAIYAYSIAAGVVTPGRIGEFIKTFHLSNRGCSFGKATASVLIDRLFDIVILLLIALIALFYMVFPEFNTIWSVAIVLICSISALLIFWLFSSLSASWIKRKSDKLNDPDNRLNNFFKKLVLVYNDFTKAIRKLRFTTLIISFALTCAAWIITFFSNYLLACSLGLSIGYLDIVGISAITSLLAQLPITILGAGTRDAGMIVLLARYGISKEKAVVLSTLFMAITLINALFCAISIFSPAVRFNKKFSS